MLLVVRKGRWRAAWARVACALVLGSAAGCAHGRSADPEASPGEASGPLRGWHYVVRIDAALTVANVDVCFEGRPPDALIPGTPEHAATATRVRASDGTALQRTRKGISLRGLADGACVEIEIDLSALAPVGASSRTATRVGKSMLVRPSAWLWRPDTLPQGADVTLRFALPEGMSVSVPWPTKGQTPRGPEATYTLDATAFRWLGYTAWGVLDILQHSHVGVAMEVVALDDDIACTDRGLAQWLDHATETVALLFDGRFPREHLQVVLVPVHNGGGSVYFGMAARGGGSGIFIMIDDQAQGDDLVGGWTTVHEMLHHGMPFIHEPWMAEGWVTYYTELMRTRHGDRDEVEGWARLADGFARGQSGGRGQSLGATSDAMHKVFAYQRVYWGGAAIAFLTDVALRQDSGGRLSLDDAMVELRRCCGDTPKRWHAQDLLTHLDQWYGKPLFTAVAQENLASVAFPPVGETLAGLGVTVGADGQTTLSDAHAGAQRRRSMMAPRQ